jgi:hypothetical protein
MINPDHLEKEADEYRKEPAKFDSDNAALAKSNFDSQVGFADAVDAEIKPCIQELAIADRKGTTFYFGSNWISSNSHVVASLEELAIASLAGEGLAGDVFSGFFRPKVLGDYPDIMVANISDNSDNKSIPILWFSLSECHAESLTFYIDIYDRENPVKLLNKIEDAKSGLLAYRQADGKNPEPGTSGSPIVEARLVITKKDSPPQWVFALQGVLFAYQKETLNVYAVELGKDLEQIRQKMLFKKQEQERAQELGKAAINLGINPACFWSDAAKAEASHDKELVCYNEGVGASIIDLPDNLVPLLGNGVLSLKESLFFNDSLWSSNIDSLRHLNKLRHTDKNCEISLTVSNLECELEKELFMQLAGVDATLNLNEKGNGVYKTNRLRLDLDGLKSSIGGVRITVQDNFRKTDGKRLKIKVTGEKKAQPASSVFASVRIYSERETISAKLVKQLLNLSYKEGMAYRYIAPSIITNKLTYSQQLDLNNDGNRNCVLEELTDKDVSGLYYQLVTSQVDDIVDSLANKYFADRPYKTDQLDLLLKAVSMDADIATTLKIMQALIWANINIHALDGCGNTFLHRILVSSEITDPSKLALIKELIRHGCDINVKNKNGICPLILAIKKGYADVATALIESGADENVVDSKGNAALDLARTYAEQNKGFDVVVKKIVAKIEESSKSSKISESSKSSKISKNSKNIENRNSGGPKRS